MIDRLVKKSVTNERLVRNAFEKFALNWHLGKKSEKDSEKCF